MSTDPRVVLRDILEDLDRNPPDVEQESTAAERAALYAFLQSGVAKHLLAANARETHAKGHSIKRREEVPPVLSAREGWYQIVNTGDSIHTAPIDAGHFAPVPPGETFVESDPTIALSEQIENGTLSVFPPEYRDPSWRGALTQLGWERRAQYGARAHDAAVLSDCLPHVRFNMRDQIKAQIATLESKPPTTTTTTTTTTAPKSLAVTRLRASHQGQ